MCRPTRRAAAPPRAGPCRARGTAHSSEYTSLATRAQPSAASPLPRTGPLGGPAHTCSNKQRFTSVGMQLHHVWHRNLETRSIEQRSTAEESFSHHILIQAAAEAICTHRDNSAYCAALHVGARGALQIRMHCHHAPYAEQSGRLPRDRWEA